MVHQAYAAFSPSSVTVREADGGSGGEVHRVSANGASPAGRQGTMVAWGPIVGIEGRLGIGLFDPCELGLMLGISRLAGEVRCALIAVESGGPAASLSGAFGYVPFFSRDGWWGRLAAEVSTARAPWRALFGAAASMGPESYSVAVDADEDFTLPGDAFETYALMKRREARLSLAVGLAYSGPNHRSTTEIDGIMLRGYKGTTYVLGLVPYFTLGSGRARFECVGCASGDVERFDVTFGASIVVGVGWFNPDGIPSPFAPERARLD